MSAGTAKGGCASLSDSAESMEEELKVTQWTDLLFNSPYGLGSLIVILVVIGIGGYLAWFLVTRSR